MKNRIKILLLTVFAGAVSCTGNFEDYNVDNYAPGAASPDVIYPAMINALMFVQQNDAQMAEGMIGQLSGQFAQANRWGGQNFDTYNQSEEWNQSFYAQVYKAIYSNYFQIEKYSGGKGHWMAWAKLVRAAAIARVVDVYGPLPYSQANNGLMYVPYDDPEEFYRTVIDDLQNSASTLYAYATENPDSHPLGDTDPVYKGDYLAWARLANSYALRYAVRTADSEAIQRILVNPAGLIEDNSQNAMRDCGAQSNPYYLHSESWGELRANADIVDYMNGYEDPRRTYYFTQATIAGHYGTWYGMPSGHSSFDMSTARGYSKPRFTAEDKLPVFVAAETKFLLAEAALNGWVSGDAKTYYEAGIRLSMEQWGVMEYQISSYLSNSYNAPDSHTNDTFLGNYTRNTTVKIAWDAEPDKHLEQIITQKWIALYPNVLEAWAEWRRTGYPELTPETDNLSNGVVANRHGWPQTGGARRLAYPLQEKDYNRTNYDNAVSTYLKGPDTQATDLFWTYKN